MGSTEWTSVVLTNRDDTFRVASLNVELSMAAIDGKTTFPLAIRLVDD